MSYPQNSFSSTSFPQASFISRRRQLVFEKTLLYQLQVLKRTGRYDAFKLKWHPSYGDKPDVWPAPNHLFWDSDVAKWIEGACYFLQWKGDAEVDAAVCELVEMIRSAQQPDGYLNIHFTVVDPGGRFTNLRDLHELYNAGHLVEAALAHQQYYGNNLLMEPILKYVNLLSKTFGPDTDQKHGYPGHPEIELALLRLYERTGDTKHLALARYFIDERGNPTGQEGQHYYDFENAARGDRENERPAPWPANRFYAYMQAHEPIVDQKTIEGHSVRAMYLLTAVADIVRLESSPAQRAALERLWSSMADKKMYLTGGIGAVKQWEGFGGDYFLPSGTDEGGCYAETCAAIGVMMLAERLLQVDLDGRYGDIMELCFYNAVMTGMAANGTQFTYVNQLASSDADLSKRSEWFTCACCPPNITRLLGYIGGYIWTFEADEDEKSTEVNVHMYTSARLSIPIGQNIVELEQRSKWPWEGKVEFALRDTPSVSVAIKLRIPGWAKDWKISPEPPTLQIEKGYLTLSQDWLKVNPKFELDIPLKARFVSPHSYTNQDIVALARGPIIYCLEDIDNAWVKDYGDHFKNLCLDPERAVIEEETVGESEIGEPYVGLSVDGGAASFLDFDYRLAPHVPLGSSRCRKKHSVDKLRFIPYALRDNRGGKGQMRVGIRREP